MARCGNGPGQKHEAGWASKISMASTASIPLAPRGRIVADVRKGGVGSHPPPDANCEIAFLDVCTETDREEAEEDCLSWTPRCSAIPVFFSTHHGGIHNRLPSVAGDGRAGALRRPAFSVAEAAISMSSSGCRRARRKPR